jgi:ParB-like chromosome segregation protein Spo0J
LPTHDLTVEAVPVGDLHTYYRNPRRGNTTVIAQSLKAHGQYKAITVNRGTHTGREDEVLAGNHTLMAARDLGWETIDVSYVDVDDDEAARIVAIDNRSSDLAENDDRLLLELLATLPDLDGTGYDPGDVEALEKLLGAPPEDTPPDEFPPFDEGIKTEFQCPKCSYEWSGKPK